MSAGDTVPVPGWSMGGRGQERTEAYPNARHILHQRIISDSEHVDHYLTADEALKARVRRLKEQGYKHTVDGHKITYDAPNGDVVTLEYLTPETAKARKEWPAVVNAERAALFEMGKEA